MSRAEFEQLKAERDQLVDRWPGCRRSLKTPASAPSARRSEFRDYATGSVVEQFLPVMDNFELALKSDGYDGAVALRRELIVKQMEEFCSRCR